MKVTAHTIQALAARREERRMKAAGYRKHETDWEIHRGGRQKERIVDAQISQCGKYVWTKLGLEQGTYQVFIAPSNIRLCTVQADSSEAARSTVAAAYGCDKSALWTKPHN